MAKRVKVTIDRHFSSEYHTFYAPDDFGTNPDVQIVKDFLLYTLPESMQNSRFNDTHHKQRKDIIKNAAVITLERIDVVFAKSIKRVKNSRKKPLFAGGLGSFGFSGDHTVTYTEAERAKISQNEWKEYLASLSAKGKKLAIHRKKEDPTGAKYRKAQKKIEAGN